MHSYDSYRNSSPEWLYFRIEETNSKVVRLELRISIYVVSITSYYYIISKITSLESILTEEGILRPYGSWPIQDQFLDIIVKLEQPVFLSPNSYSAASLPSSHWSSTIFLQSHLSPLSGWKACIVASFLAEQSRRWDVHPGEIAWYYCVAAVSM